MYSTDARKFISGKNILFIFMKPINDIVCDLLKTFLREKDEDKKDVLTIGRPITVSAIGVRMGKSCNINFNSYRFFEFR